jgi:hypothetical protein
MALAFKFTLRQSVIMVLFFIFKSQNFYLAYCTSGAELLIY